MKITSSRFERAAVAAGDEPRTLGPLVVFLGRSNVGKSSLINRLLGSKSLARTSSAPGRTQTVNFYRINETFDFVDLPGYGYAAAPEHVRKSWGPMVDGFLERRREHIALAVLLLDARREPSELDGVMKDWLEAKGVPHVVAVVKTDKLAGNARAVAARTLERWLAAPRQPAPGLLVSAHTGVGIRELWTHLDRALAKKDPSDRGERWTSVH